MRFSSPWKDCFFQEESVANHCKSQVERMIIWGARERKEAEFFLQFQLNRAPFIWNKQGLQKPTGWKSLNLQFLYKTLSQCMGYHLLVRAAPVSYSSWVSTWLWNFSHATSYLGNSLTLLLIQSVSQCVTSIKSFAKAWLHTNQEFAGCASYITESKLQFHAVMLPGLLLSPGYYIFVWLQ